MQMKAQLGVIVALIGILCVVNTEMIRLCPWIEYYRVPITAISLALGLILVFCGVRGRRSRNAGPVSPAEGATTCRFAEDREDDDSFSLTGVEFAGTVIIAIGAAFYFLQVMSAQMPVIARSLKPTPRPAATNAPPPAPVPEAPLNFPSIKVEGLFLNASRPSAIIDRRSFFVGDAIGAATIVRIDYSGVLLEQRGETKLYRLRLVN